MPIIPINTASTPVLPANRVSGKKVILSNRGANTIWCTQANTAVVGEGFPIDAGDKIILDRNSNELTGELNAIAEGAATNLSVYEIK